MVKCNKCKFQYCIYHEFLCGCGLPHIKVVYRYSTKELTQFLQKIRKAVGKELAFGVIEDSNEESKHQ
jgi:hypothetical protein